MSASVHQTLDDGDVLGNADISDGANNRTTHRHLGRRILVNPAQSPPHPIAIKN